MGQFWGHTIICPLRSIPRNMVFKSIFGHLECFSTLCLINSILLVNFFHNLEMNPHLPIEKKH